MNRVAMALGLASALALSACGSTTERTTEKTVIVNPDTGQTVVVPPEGHPYRCTPNGVC